VTNLFRTNQNPRIGWRRAAPPTNSWVLCLSTLGDSYTNHKIGF